MSVQPPSLDDLASIAASYHLQPTTQDLEWYRELMSDLLASYAHLDQLVMPTLPYKATRIPPADASRDVYMQHTTGMGANMGPFDVTGHPAINVPCG
jgi:Asp-tRNA(Asn)/Glu-tRNA(Gln) amidotransferase A subunit family amidase